jgi:putative heme-binding domain-containing protein
VAELQQRVRSKDWNHYAIRARGAEAVLEVNGARTARVVDRRATRRLSGTLALQLHQGGPMRVEFKNFELRRLAPIEPVAADEVPAPRYKPSFTGVPPQWIWTRPNAPDGDVATLVRRFEISGASDAAVLHGAADNHVRAFVNGELAFESDDWAAPVEIDVSKLVREGENELAFVARNDGGPAAAWMELIAKNGSAKLVRVVTDTSWSAAPLAASSTYATWTPGEFDATHASPPHSHGEYGVGPWGGNASPTPPEPEEPALAGEALQLLDGFRAELLYSVPKATQGSWVSLCVDPAGRFYASDQYGGLFRITVGETAADTRVERVPVELGSAQGLCWAFDSLYVVASVDEAGLYRVRDSNGDDVLDQVELLRRFDEGGEHGPHAVVLGPDDRLWIVGGNHTRLPEPIDSYRRPKNWAEDILLPRIEDPNGHAVGIRAPAGWVVSTDRDAQHWELFACGFRNAYDIAFDLEGELFTFDSDMEWDVGAPWYQPTRIFHVVSGADFGWRGGPGKMPPSYPDTLPSVVDIGLSSPTGVTFAYDARFPPRYRRALYALDWAYGKIYAVHLQPKGASFSGNAEVFCSGTPFPVTDVVIGRDGAMYVTTGGRRAKSGLYRITYAGETPEELASAPNAEQTKRDMLAPERERRRALEEGHVELEETGPDRRRLLERSASFARRELDDPDPFIRHAARVRLEHVSDLSVWGDRPIKLLRGGMQRVIACCHVGGTEARYAALRELADIPVDTVGEGLFLSLLRTHQLAMIRFAPLEPAVLADFRTRFERFYPTGRRDIDRELLQLLVALDCASAIEPALAVMESDAAQEEKIWCGYCLRVQASGWSVEQRRRYFLALDELRKTAKGGFSLLKYVDEIRKQAADALSEAERAELGELVAPPVAVTAGSNALAVAFVRAWTTADLAPLVRQPSFGRDFANGHAAFAKARCLECHRIAGEGGSGVGPDLTGAAARFSRLDLLETILEPSKSITDQYQDTEVLTLDGDLYVGRIERDDENGVALHRLPPQDDVIEIPRDQISRRRLHPLSRMPSALLDVLTEAEILDLFTYVLAGGDPKHEAFR